MPDTKRVDKSLELLIQAIIDRLSTPEGAKALKDAATEAAQFSAEMKEKRQLDPSQLYERVTL